MKEINEFEQWAEDMSYDVNEGFDPESYEKEIEYEFAGDDGEPGYGHIQCMVNVVDGRPVVDPKSLKATCNGDGNNKLTDEWCTSMVQPGGEEHEEALLACQEEADDEWASRDVDVPMEDAELDEGKMKGLALDMEELSDEEFEEKYQSKKSDWQEVQNKDLRMDPDQPAYIKKMKDVAGVLAAEGEEDDEIEPFSSDDYDEYGVRQSTSFNTPPEKMKKVKEEYAPSVGDLIVTGKGTRGTVETVTDEAVEFRTETGKLLRTAVSNVQPDAVNEEDFEEGNEFTLALANAKRDGKKEFEVDGKVYKVEENYAERLRTLINW